MDDIDLLSGSLENAVGTIGGFCGGKAYVVDHQVSVFTLIPFIVSVYIDNYVVSATIWSRLLFLSFGSTHAD